MSVAAPIIPKRASVRTGLMPHTPWTRLMQSRGGDTMAHVSLDEERDSDGEDLPFSAATQPDEAFDREWALTLLDHVLKELRADYAAQGKGDLFDLLQPALNDPGEAAEGLLRAQRAGLTPGAYRVAVHRLRLRFRNLLFRQVAATVESEDQVEPEIRAMITMLRKS